MEDAPNKRRSTRSAVVPSQTVPASATIKQEAHDVHGSRGQTRQPIMGSFQEASSSNSNDDPLALEMDIGGTSITFHDAFFNVRTDSIKTEHMAEHEIEDSGEALGSSSKRRKNINEADSGDESGPARNRQQSIVKIPSKFSEVWKHFVRQGKAAQCHHCLNILSTSNGSTSNLKRHMKNKHPLISLDEGRINKHPLISLDEGRMEMTETAPSTSWDESSTIEPDISKNVRSHHPVSNAGAVKTSGPSTLLQKNQLDEALLYMICDECLPFNIVEGETFKRFIRMLNPKYDLPNRQTISDELLTDSFLEALERVRENLIETKSVSLTLDSWTNAHNRCCLAATAHYINNDFNLVSNLLECIDYAHQHGDLGRDVAEWMNQVLLKYKVEDKIQAIVTDNATDIVKYATMEMNVEHLPCFAHTLNLVVQNAVQNSIQETVYEIRRLVNYFQTNTNASKKLSEAQTTLRLPCIKLKQDVASRWNSTYDMMDRFLQNKDPILACSDSVEHNLQFNDWIIVEQSMKVLLNFEHATKVLTADKFVTLSQTGLLSNILLTKMRALLKERLEFPVKKLATNLIEELSARCKPYLQSNLVCRAMVLDPRMKSHSFENDRQRYEETYQSLIETITPLKTPATTTTEPVVQKSFADPSLQSLFSDFATSIKRVKTNAHPEMAAKLELDEYLKMDCIELTEDPLLWWKTYKSQFPALCQIVQRLFCIPATSVPPERIFSKAGEIYSVKRATLSPGKMSEVLFLQQNKKCITPQ